MIDAHPLRSAEIVDGDEQFQVDELSRRVHERDGRRVHGRTFATKATTLGRPEWRWGKRAQPSSNCGAPVIMGPTDLLPDRRPEAPSLAITPDESRRRLQGR